MAKTRKRPDLPPVLEHFVPAHTQSERFSTIRQGSATNVLSKVTTRQVEQLEFNIVTGAVTLQKGGLTLTVEDYNRMTSGLKQSSHRLLDALVITFTERGARDTTVMLPLEEYMAMCNLRDKKEARKQVNADLEVLFNLRMSYKGTSTRDQDFLDIRLCDAKGIKNGIIIFSFTQPFYQLLMGYSVMPYPNELFLMSPKYNPNSFYLGRKISELKHMNAGKNNEDRIAVATLLKECPELPSYDEVMASDKHVDQRIIKPFERDMDALESVFTWSYCHSNGAPLEEAEVQHFTYAIFIRCLVSVAWRIYPDQTQRLQAKERRKASTKTRKTPAKKN